MNRDTDRLVADVRAWIGEDPDPQTREELEGLLREEAWGELEERFSGPLQFGTAGLRGLVGGGLNRMNRVTVARATAALARQLMAHVEDAAQRGVVVARDGRHMSEEFAEMTAEILMGHGLNVHFLPGTTPTPVAAFTGRHLGASATVVVTASHNPPAYNGYKVYSERHVQIVPPQDAQIRDLRHLLPPFATLPRLSFDQGRSEGLLRPVDSRVLDAYFEALNAQCFGPDVPPSQPRIVTTALHGVGHPFVERALLGRGFSDLHPVLEQAEPDPDFPTVTFPNPEEDGALDLAVALGRRVGAELLIANDPDTDRLALGVFKGPEISLLTGNQVGILLADWLLASAKEAGSLPAESVVLTTVVSTRMLDVLAASYGVRSARTLTGFKWIWDQALHLRDEGVDFRFGFEEALGYCVGQAVRDKDGIGAALVAAELCAHLKAEGKTLLDRLEELWCAHGFYASAQVAFTLEGLAGRRAIEEIMSFLRKRPFQHIHDVSIWALLDFKSMEGPLGGADVLQWDLEDGSRILFRPSGTEPKIKAYIETSADVGPEGLDRARKVAFDRLDSLREWVYGLFTELTAG